MLPREEINTEGVQVFFIFLCKVLTDIRDLQSKDSDFPKNSKRAMTISTKQENYSLSFL